MLLPLFVASLSKVVGIGILRRVNSRHARFIPAQEGFYEPANEKRGGLRRPSWVIPAADS
jgi:hypothetical protein